MMLRKLVPRSDFTANVLTLLTGTTLAQLFLVGSSPILTRLYNPANYGIYTLFLGITTLTASFATGKYELAINLASNDRDARDIIGISLLLTIAACAASVPVFIFGSGPIAGMLHNQRIAPWLLAVSLCTLCIASFSPFNYWFNRRKNYKMIARAKVSSSIAFSLCAIALGLRWHDFGGLILSFILGQGIASCILGLKIFREEGPLIEVSRLPAYWAQAQRYKKFPIFLMPGVWINSLASQIYIFLISGYFGVATLGAVSLSQTAIVLPTSLISVAFAEVFRQRAIEDFNTTGTCRPLLLKTIRKLFLISIVPFTLFFFLAPMLFAIVFGKQWYVAGTYAQLLTVNNMARFILAPVSGVVIQLSERLEVDIAWQLTFLAANFSSVYFGNMFFHDIRMVLILYSVADVGLYLFAFYFAYRFSQKRPPGMKGGSIDAYAGIA